MFKILTIGLFLLVVIISQDSISVPQKYVDLTQIWLIDSNYSIIHQYLQRYNEQQCYADLIQQINIVWNNEQSPTEAGIYKRQQYWKIPVYFYRTTFNSMDHRYRLPKQSKSKVLYSLDDDIIVDCETFRKTFALYNSQKKYPINPIVANEVRGFAYHLTQLNKPEFAYQGHKNAPYFTIAEPGAAFIDRHYLEIYYLLLPEVAQLRKIVRNVNNCDDIFFFALTQHFYPQLLPVYNPTEANYKNTDPKIGQSKVKGVFPLRDKCVNDISEVLGYNPLRFIDRNTTQKGWQYENLERIIELRTNGIAELKFQPAKEKDEKNSLIETQVQQLQHQITGTTELTLEAQQRGGKNSLEEPKLPKLQSGQNQITDNTKLTLETVKKKDDEKVFEEPKFSQRQIPIPTSGQNINKQIGHQQLQTESDKQRDISGSLSLWMVIAILALAASFVLFLFIRMLGRYRSLRKSAPVSDIEEDSQVSPNIRYETQQQ